MFNKNYPFYTSSSKFMINHLNTLIEMGYDSNIATNALQENDNDLFNSINYLLDI